jgi:hypothetical protein
MDLTVEPLPVCQRSDELGLTNTTETGENLAQSGGLCALVAGLREVTVSGCQRSRNSPVAGV